MSYVLVNRPSVKSDILNIINYYNSTSPELSKLFLFRLKEAQKYISRSPLGFQLKYKNVRTLLLRQFPYHIHFIVDDLKMRVIIIGIIHAYKNPADH